MPLGIGPLEIVIVLIIVLVIFGPKRLPDLGRSLGRGMREFKDSVTGQEKEELPAASEPVQAPEPEKAQPVAASPPTEQNH
ncbi:MAG: twin-arginine translocase TatA/TatE family subunit [Thermoleophilaceae bacterium]